MITEDNIFLIGFMGSGKTTLAKRLAKKLKKPFFDLDTEIEKKEGLSIDEIFEKEGEEYFRKIERKLLKAIIKENKGFILSLGGGTPCFYDNMELINASGTSFYLKYNVSTLTSRLIDAKKQRPLIKDLTDVALKKYIKIKLSERERFYDKCTFIVEKKNVRVDNLTKLL